MDLSLPEIDGWEATKRLKADPTTQPIPISALTAHAMDGDRFGAIGMLCNAPRFLYPLRSTEFERVRLLPSKYCQQ